MKYKLIVLFFVVFLGASLPCFADYQPDVKMTFSLDGATFSEGKSKDLMVGEVFYLRLDCSVKVDMVRSLIGPKSIECGIAFRNPRIIDVEPDENTVSVRLVEALQPTTAYAFRIPATTDGQRKVHIIFRCTPQKTGIQEIRIAFDNNVDQNTYQINFRLQINQ
jgi:hypothetical protein